MPRRVFISHASRDLAEAERLAQALRAAGFTVRLDRWELEAGDSFIEWMNRALAETDAGLILFSKAAQDSPWVRAEIDFLTYARIREGRLVLPVRLDEEVRLPPLLRPLLYLRAHQTAEIIRALDRPALVWPDAAAAARPGNRLTVTLAGEAACGLTVQVRLNGILQAEERHDQLPGSLATAVKGYVLGDSMHPDPAARLARVGEELGRFCLPGDSGEAVTRLLSRLHADQPLEVVVEAANAQLLGLPFEALRLPNGYPLALIEGVTLWRLSASHASSARDAESELPTGAWAAPAGPLKILAAAAAPVTNQAAPLDIEREMQTILDATEEASRDKNAEVRILEYAHPAMLREALGGRDRYHVLHLSCHGQAGSLLLEDEDGAPVPTSAEELIAPLREGGQLPGLILLSACHSGRPATDTASLALRLLEAGIPAVIAMQAAVSDAYASELAGAVYHELCHAAVPLAGRALARARRQAEQARLKRQQEGGSAPPEYGTAALYLAGAEDLPLADFSPLTPQEPLSQQTQRELGGPVPQLRMDALIGRRLELRQLLGLLRDSHGAPGVLVQGIGGIGKSVLCGRAIRRLYEEHWRFAAVRGPITLDAVAEALRNSMVERRDGIDESLTSDLKRTRDDEARQRCLIQQLLAETPTLLVLDDFEQNLGTEGATFLNQEAAHLLDWLASCCQRGRLLLTCRHPLPGPRRALLKHLPLGPLSEAEMWRLRRRLPCLRDREPAEVAPALRVLRGHPRLLELLDALLNQGRGRLAAVTLKLIELEDKLSASAPGAVAPEGEAPDLEAALARTIALGARDILLADLFAAACRLGQREPLIQVAVSNLPVSPQGLAHMLAGAPGDPQPLMPGLGRLADLSLLHRFPDGKVWLHRWTAEGLAGLAGEADWRAAQGRAGRYRTWRVANESHALEDGIEAVRNLLAAGDWELAGQEAVGVLAALERFDTNDLLSELASEWRRLLPPDVSTYSAISFFAADATFKLGNASEALALLTDLLVLQSHQLREVPSRADYQRDLSVSYNKMGNLYQALGKGQEAHDAFQNALTIRLRLAQAEPNRTDYQRDLSVSYNRMGNLYQALGEGQEAHDAFQNALTIALRLTQAEPNRADYQRDLSVCYDKMGDLYQALGRGELAAEYYQKDLEIALRLAQAEPNRADYQRDLSVTYQRMGDLYRALGKGQEAHDAFQNAHTIALRLAQAEPNRADYQRDLSVSYQRMGNLYQALGEGQEAHDAFQNALTIRLRLTQAEPGRADYQRDLSFSYNKMGDLYQALGEGQEAHDAFQNAHTIALRLAQAEPNRTDYQRDLIVSHVKLHGSTGKALHLASAYEIASRLYHSGRLNLAVHWMVEDLRQRLHLAGVEPEAWGQPRHEADGQATRVWPAAASEEQDMTPDTSFNASVRAGYDRWAAVYDHDGNPLQALEEPELRRLAGDPGGLDCLDLGCGTGRHALWLAEKGGKVTAVDFSGEMLERARAKPGAERVRFLQLDLRELGVLQDGAYDLAVSGLVLEHIEDLESFFGQLRRVLRLGGRAVLSAMHPRMFEKGAWARFTDPASGEVVAPGSLPHALEDFIVAATNAGFTLEELVEKAPDAAFAECWPRAARYLDWPMVAVLAFGT